LGVAFHRCCSRDFSACRLVIVGGVRYNFLAITSPFAVGWFLEKVFL
jgi:hypothetical protein